MCVYTLEATFFFSLLERIQLCLYVPLLVNSLLEKEALFGVFTITDKRAEQALKIAI